MSRDDEIIDHRLVSYRRSNRSRHQLPLAFVNEYHRVMEMTLRADPGPVRGRLAFRAYS